jgi:hypothetical protein
LIDANTKPFLSHHLYIRWNNKFVGVLTVVFSTVGAAVGGWVGAWVSHRMWVAFHPLPPPTQPTTIPELTSALVANHAYTEEVYTTLFYFYSNFYRRPKMLSST